MSLVHKLTVFYLFLTRSLRSQLDKLRLDQGGDAEIALKNADGEATAEATMAEKLRASIDERTELLETEQKVIVLLL